MSKNTANKTKKNQMMAVSVMSAVCCLVGCGQDDQVKALFFGGHTAHAKTTGSSANNQSINSETAKQLENAVRNTGFTNDPNTSADTASGKSTPAGTKSGTIITTEKQTISSTGIADDVSAEDREVIQSIDTQEGLTEPKVLTSSVATKTVTKATKVTNSSYLTDALESAQSFLATANTLTNLENTHLKFPIKDSLRENVSQQFLGVNDIEQRLIEVLPEIEYHTDGMSDFATKVNTADWQINKRVDPATTIKIQALLNWHNHGVGAVDGKFAGNTVKAMQTFQKARGIKPTGSMNEITWKLLTADSALASQPVLVKYKLTQEDVSLPIQWGNKKNVQYTSVREQLAEKFHMSRGLLYRLNPNTKLRAGNFIIVYNPGQPNQEPVSRVEVYKAKNLLVAYNAEDKIVASYPTTIGSNSPSGTHYVANRVYRPHYNSDFNNKNSVLPPGPNNPVGLVWMGLSKPSFGIHGSPQPEMISRQRSGGCVRLTNWDALSLFGTMQHKAKVEFK